MNRVTPRVLGMVVMTLLTWPFVICMSEAQQSITQQSTPLHSTTQSGQVQVLVIGESMFTSNAQYAIAVTEEGVFIIDAQYVYSVTAHGTCDVAQRAGPCVCLPQRCCCSPVGAPCRWCPSPAPC
jgi:hypothetical protein